MIQDGYPRQFGEDSSERQVIKVETVFEISVGSIVVWTCLWLWSYRRQTKAATYDELHGARAAWTLCHIALMLGLALFVVLLVHLLGFHWTMVAAAAVIAAVVGIAEARRVLQLVV